MAAICGRPAPHNGHQWRQDETMWTCSGNEVGHPLRETPLDVQARALEKVSDAVNHPPHYGGSDDLYEAIKVIEAWGLGFHLGNVVKYIARADHKGSPIEDLKKARFYIDREIQRREGS